MRITSRHTSVRCNSHTPNTLFFSCFPLHPAGLQTSVQDWPGRTQLWHVGVPPSGPMDSLHARLANALVGNASDAAVLEFGLTGPTLKFHCDCLVALTGTRISMNSCCRGDVSFTCAGLSMKASSLDGANLSASSDRALHLRFCLKPAAYLPACFSLPDALCLRPPWAAPPCPGKQKLSDTHQSASPEALS